MHRGAAPRGQGPSAFGRHLLVKVHMEACLLPAPSDLPGEGEWWAGSWVRAMMARVTAAGQREAVGATRASQHMCVCMCGGTCSAPWSGPKRVW